MKKQKGPKKDNSNIKTIYLKRRKSVLIWNKAKLYRSMSDWVETQLEYHFGACLTPQQQLQMLKEELVIMQARKAIESKKIKRKYAVIEQELGDQILKLKEGHK